MVIGGMYLPVSIFLGAFFGAARGLYNGFNDPEIKKLPSVAVKRTQMLNHMVKSGSVTSQTLGSIGLIYAISDYLIHKARLDADDEINTLVAATMTGFLYKSPGKSFYYVHITVA